jgi:hypothetical protein
VGGGNGIGLDSAHIIFNQTHLSLSLTLCRVYLMRINIQQVKIMPNPKADAFSM